MWKLKKKTFNGACSVSDPHDLILALASHSCEIAATAHVHRPPPSVAIAKHRSSNLLLPPQHKHNALDMHGKVPYSAYRCFPPNVAFLAHNDGRDVLDTQ